MDEVFKKNNNAHDDDDRTDDRSHERDVEHEIEQPEGFTLTSAVYPPNPCERCVRTNKTCKGVAGARCEYCKRLKQKCSNSTGPARGKHAAAARLKAAAATIPGKGASHNSVAESSTASKARPKRKLSLKPSAYQNGDYDSDEGELDDDGHEPPAKLNKKRRTAISGAINRANIMKYVGELEATISRLQASTAKEVDKAQALIRAISAEMRDTEDE